MRFDLLGVARKREEAKDAMDEFAVGQEQKDRTDHAKVQGEQRRHERAVTQEQKGESSRTGREQCQREGDIHARAIGVAQLGVALPFRGKEADRADDEA